MNQKRRRKGNFFIKAFDRLCGGCYHIAAWMIFAMAVIMSYEVLARYFFNRPTIWVSDFTDYIMLYSTFFVSAWLLKNDGHIRLTILYEHLSPRSKQISDMINSFIGAIVCGFVIWYGAKDTWDAVAKGISLPRPIPVPKYLVLGVIPFGCLLLFVQFLRNGFKFLSYLKAGAEKEAES